jgi:hypothetical protein
MNENEAASTGDWLTVSQAAAALEVSERTIQRRCKSGALAARLVSADDGQQWQINGATLPTGAAIAADRVPPQFKHETEAADTLGATGAATLPTGAAIVPPQVPTGADTQRIAEMREEIIFLRGVVEAQNRDAAEMRATMRALVQAQTLALTAGTSNDGSAAKLEQVGTGLEADGDEMQPEFRAQTDTTGKETGEAQSGANKGKEKQSERKTFRRWLLQVLRG